VVLALPALPTILASMQTLRLRHAVAASALTLVAAVTATTPLAAQSSDPAGPRGGTWGGEVLFPSARASLLRFVSPRTALVLTFDGFVAGIEREQPTFGGEVETEESDASGFNVGIGLRNYTGSGQLRPVRGLGVFAGRLTDVSDARQTTYGAYGEFGAHWFFTPHVSVGAIGELRATWRDMEFASGPSRFEQRSWSVDLMVVRVGGAVYF
jgi:hypothetical protein